MKREAEDAQSRLRYYEPSPNAPISDVDFDKIASILEDHHVRREVKTFVMKNWKKEKRWIE